MASGEVEPRYNSRDSHEGHAPPDWAARRAAVIERDEGTCQRCGGDCVPSIAGNDDVLAKVRYRTSPDEGGTNELSNLETVCERCRSYEDSIDVFGPEGGPESYHIDQATTLLTLLLLSPVTVGLYFALGSLIEWFLEPLGSIVGLLALGILSVFAGVQASWGSKVWTGGFLWILCYILGRTYFGLDALPPANPFSVTFGLLLAGPLLGVLWAQIRPKLADRRGETYAPSLF